MVEPRTRPETIPHRAAGEAAGDVAVWARDVSITYRVYEERRSGLRDLVSRGFRPRPSRAVHAVRGVSFELHRGETLGIVGPNGSGKSTLLRAVAGLLPVTDGAVYVNSRPLLLGVEGALKPQLSGRRNISIGCLALGLSRKEIDERMDDLVRFAGLHDFIDMPMKTYSSGMRARLQFAIATAVTPEILLVDEALAVGDRRFRRRSWRKLTEITENAGAVVLVSHSLREIRKNCSRAIWLQDGRIVMEGPTDEIADAYAASEDGD